MCIVATAAYGIIAYGVEAEMIVMEGLQEVFVVY